MRTRITAPTQIAESVGPIQVRNWIWDNDRKYWKLNSTDTISVSAQRRVSYSESSITDSPKAQRTTKPVLHMSRDFESYDVPVLTESNRGYPGDYQKSLYEYSGRNPHWYSWGDYGQVDHSNIKLEYANGVEQLAQQAVQRFYDTNEVDTLLNVIESPQLVSSLRSLKDLAWRLASVKRGKLKVRGIDVSNTYLAWQFGYAPLISDMRKIARSITTLRAAMNRAVERAGKPYVSAAHAIGKVSLIGSMGRGYNATELPIADTHWWHPQVINVRTPTLRVGVRGVRSIPYSSNSFRKLDYLMNRFLSTGPASFVWERIPFSFVVDWFVDLSGVMQSLDQTLTGSTKRITDAWSSESYILEIDAIKHRTLGWISDTDGRVMRRNRLRYYRRDPLSLSMMPSWSGRFGKKQVGLSAALLHQIVANLRKSR